METIGKSELWSFESKGNEAVPRTSLAVRKHASCYVGSYVELAKRIAELQFMNRDHVLLFRGQRRDYRNAEGLTTLKPRLFRPTKNSIVPPGQNTLVERFEKLKNAEKALITRCNAAKVLGRDRLERQRVLRWAILQHYEVCRTPLLDVTASLRIAASFAALDAPNEANIFVLGVPNVSGSITASAEAGLQIVRLASACPPSALRPHLQEGYLLGEYPEMADYEQKGYYKHIEIDFGRRLVAKFQFNPATFWGDDAFPKVDRDALYPTREHDPLDGLTRQVKSDLGN